MLKKTAQKLADSGYIQEKYVELYAIAMEMLLAMIVNLFTVLLVGYLLHMLWYSVILFAAYIPLRSYAGGYHARGYIVCYMESCLLLTAILLLIKYVLLEGIVVWSPWFVFAVSAAVIVALAPLADENKPISEKEALVFKKRTRMILLLETAIAGILAWLKSGYCYAVMMAVVFSALLLIVHKCRESMQGKAKSIKTE